MMSSSSSPTIDKVIGKIVEEVLREGAEQPKNQETTPEEVREENEEVEVDAGESRAFYSDKGGQGVPKVSRKERVRRGKRID